MLNPSELAGEVRYQARKTATNLSGKTVQLGLRSWLGGGSALLATKVSAPFREALNLSQVPGATVTMGEAMAASAGSVASIGVGAGVNAYVNHLEYKQENQRLCNLYRPQIGSIMGIEPSQVRVDDLKAVAETNPTLDDEIDRHRKRRNVKNAASIIGMGVAFVGVVAAVALLPGLGAFAAAAATAGLFSMTGALFAGLSAVAGFGLYQGSSSLVEKKGKKMTGLDSPSVDDCLGQLGKQVRKGHGLAQEQVMGVYAQALPELGERIEEEYGKSYDKLSPAEQTQITQTLGASYRVSDVTEDINAGQMNVRELTFRMHGQSSGVYPEKPLRERIKTKAKSEFAEKAHELQEFGERVGEWRENRRNAKEQDDVAELLDRGREHDEEKDTIRTRWRDRVSRKSHEENLDVASGGEDKPKIADRWRDKISRDKSQGRSEGPSHY